MSTEEDGELTLDCYSQTRDLTRDMTDIFAIGERYAGIVPGSIVSTNLAAYGVLQNVPIARGGVVLVTDQPVQSPTRSVPVASLDGLQEGVSDLIREIDSVYGTLDQTAARVVVTVDEAHSFDQMLQSLQVDAAFSAPFVSAGFGTGLRDRSSVRQRTAVVRLFQPMYTISVADDRLPRNRDFFASNVDWSEGGAACGAIMGERPPAYVRSVTYGRMVVFTVTSEEFHSASELAIALRGSYEGLTASGSVSIERREEYQQMLERSNLRVLVLGGSQEVAFDAIRTGDFRELLQPSRAVTAVPLSMRLHYLAEGRPLFSIRSTTRFTESCCTPSNCPPPPLLDFQHGSYRLNTGWHLGGTGGATWDVRGGACTDGRARLRIEGRRVGGNGTCWGEWLSSDPTDCRAVLRYTRPGSSFLDCNWIIFESEEGEHPEPLCRTPGCG